MDFLKQCLGKQINFDIPGDGVHSGVMVDVGPDIIVVSEDSKYLYIPLHHVRHLTLNPQPEPNISVPQPSSQSNHGEITYASTLGKANGLFCEFYLAEHSTLYGYMTDIQTDYFTIFSPLNKTMMIPLSSLKWMSPFDSGAAPYSMSRSQIEPSKQNKSSFAATFGEQLRVQEGSIISLNEGLNTNQIGLLQKFENDMLQLITADGRKHYYHIQHVKNACMG
jgi:hypothetical protein